MAMIDINMEIAISTDKDKDSYFFEIVGFKQSKNFQ